MQCSEAGRVLVPLTPWKLLESSSSSLFKPCIAPSLPLYVKQVPVAAHPSPHQRESAWKYALSWTVPHSASSKVNFAGFSS